MLNEHLGHDLFKMDHNKKRALEKKLHHSLFKEDFKEAQQIKIQSF